MIVEIKADRAIFCDPIFKTERRSYPVPTPSALCGMLKAVYGKPEFYYVIDKIHVIERPKLRTEFLRYIENKASDRTTTNDGPSVPRTQAYITNPHYFVEFHLALTGKGDMERDSIDKHLAILERRLLKGQHFHPPYLGTRECVCEVELVADASDIPPSKMVGEYPLPVMVYDIPIDPLTNLPGTKVILYHPRCVDGEIDCHEGLARDISDGGFFLSLDQFYKNNWKTKDMPRIGYEEVNVPWKLFLSPEGEPVAFSPSRTQEIVNPANPEETTVRFLPERMTLPQAPLKSGLKLAAAFGWGAPDYVLGLDSDEARGREKLKIFKDRLREVGGDCEALAPIWTFYDGLDTPEGRNHLLSLIEPYADGGFITVTGSIVFEIVGKGPLLSDEDLLSRWDEETQKEMSVGKKGQCFITGEQSVVLTDSHMRVKGVYGAGSLARLISIDKSTTSLFSYGHEGLDNAPCGKEVSFRIHTALNWLLANQSVRTDKGSLVYWSDSPALTDKLAALFRWQMPDPGAEIPDGTAYHFAYLRGNGAGRVFLQEYEQLSYGDGHLAEFLERAKVEYDTIKLDLWKGETMDKNTSPYLLGVLFAEVRIAQMDAVPSTVENGGIERTLMNSVMTKPSVGVQRLLRAMRVYLQKKDYGIGLQIAETLTQLESLDNPYPQRMNPGEKSIFMHSYHVSLTRLLKERRERIEAATARKNKKETNEEVNEDEQ